MKTLISHYQEIKDKLKLQLEQAESGEQVVKILKSEIEKILQISSDYVQSLTPPQARLARMMLEMLCQYSNIISIVEQQSEENLNTLETPKQQFGLNELSSKIDSEIISPIAKAIDSQKKVQNFTSPNYYKQFIFQKISQSREIFTSLVAGGLAGVLEGGFVWGILGATIGAVTGGVIGKIIQDNKQNDVDNNFETTKELVKDKKRFIIDTDRFLSYLYQAFQSIDLTVSAYGNKSEKTDKSGGLEDNLDILEYLQELMADALDEKVQLPISVKRRIQQAATILRHYGIEARAYKALEGEDLMFNFEPSLDPEIKTYVTLKHALVRDNQVIIPGCVIEPQGVRS